MWVNYAPNTCPSYSLFWRCVDNWIAKKVPIIHFVIHCNYLNTHRNFCVWITIKPLYRGEIEVRSYDLENYPLKNVSNIVATI